MRAYGINQSSVVCPAIGCSEAGIDAYAYVGASLGNDIERTFDKIRGFVVINDRSCAAHERLCGSECGRPIQHLGV
jgi:hypothetical protein